MFEENWKWKFYPPVFKLTVYGLLTSFVLVTSNKAK